MDFYENFQQTDWAIFQIKWRKKKSRPFIYSCRFWKYVKQARKSFLNCDHARNCSFLSPIVANIFHFDFVLIWFQKWSNIDLTWFHTFFVLISYWFHVDFILISCWFSYWFQIDFILITFGYCQNPRVVKSLEKW